MSQQLGQEHRPATAAERVVLAKWSSWGAIPQVFDPDNPEWSAAREQLHELLDDAAFEEARRTTINAHYTDPAYVRSIWSTLEQLGFSGGNVLEPGSGSGTFIGMAPAGTRMVGVELDSTTAGISRGLYPDAQIHTESFADTRFPRDSFDAVVGNVPFANVSLHDPQFNAGGHSMHNHFIIKSLAMTRPGGVVAVLTSSFTMDAVSPAARREMNDMADLVGAVRLPSGAFRRSAGTEALTDLLIFRKREPGRPTLDTSWETVSAHVVDGQPIKTNTYYDIHPEHVLGQVHVGQGMYGNATVSVRADLEQAPACLAGALADIVDRARERGDVFTALTAEQAAQRTAEIPQQSNLFDGTILAHENGTFATVTAGRLSPLQVPKSAATELRALLTLRDGALELVAHEAASMDDTAQLTEIRTRLRDDYQAYVARYGPLNRYSERSTGRTDPETGEPRLARIKPRATAVLRTDPHGAQVMALERFDDETQASAPAAILTGRVVHPRPVVRGAGTPAEAVAISLDQTGGIDLPLVADMLGQDVHEARTNLAGLVYEDPEANTLVHAPEYLSGNVRAKLEVAEAAALDDDRFQVNVDALRAVKPADIGVDEISVRLGAVWIDPATHRQFLSEVLNDRSVRVENPLPGKWNVRAQKYGVKATNEFGTKRLAAGDIAEALMEQRPITVYDTVESDGRELRVLNPVETTGAQEKAADLQDRFAEWVWEDPERAARLAGEYNRRFNGLVLRDYTQAGDYLTLPGLASSFVPRPHQRAAVARIVAEPAVGLFHQVGAGKTAEMVMGAMELKRMGLVNKPTVVIPNHMIEQFSREWLQMYPQARILAVSSDDLAGDKRRLFVARAAANDWDAIIMTQTAFQRIPLSPQAEAAYIDSQVADARTALDAAEESDAMSVKQIEKSILQLEESYKKKLDQPRDPGITFESTGIDYLMIDELHMYKNLATDSNIPDARIGGSKKAADLHAKLNYLRERHGARVATGATATPLSNSITEAYVMQQFLRPDLMRTAGVTSFDGWAATFAEPVTEMEMGPAGGFRLKTRLSRFKNVPEMLRMWHVFADVKTAEDLKLPVPLVAQRGSDGKRAPEVVVIQPTLELEDYIAAIGDRAEAIAARSVLPSEDNMLLVSTDGRKAALDMRLVGGDPAPTGPVKLDAVAQKIVTEWNTTRDRTYIDDVSGEQSPIRGGLQLVFCDLSTPNPERWNAYDALKRTLVLAGMPADGIRFIHDAKNDAEKARLFAAARAGHVVVLIGSTSKMGVGTNVQSRITAMHHVDCPWRPADLEQRDGRGIRQGNQNEEVAIYRYVVERSFDSYSWQTVARKGGFIDQVISGKLDSREIEDIGDSTMSFTEVKAIASGNPLLIDKANADAALQKLRRQETSYHRGQAALAHDRAIASRTIDTEHDTVRALTDAIARTQDISGDQFAITIGDRTYTTRAEAGTALGEWSHAKGVQYLQPDTGQTLTLGTIAGHTMAVCARRPLSLMNTHGVDVELSLVGVPHTESRLDRAELLDGGIGIIRQFENKTTGLERNLTRAQQRITDAEHTLAEIDERLGKPSPYTATLAEAETKVQEVDAALATHLENTPAEPAAGNVQAPAQPEVKKPAVPARPVRRTDPNTGPYQGPGVPAPRASRGLH